MTLVPVHRISMCCRRGAGQRGVGIRRSPLPHRRICPGGGRVRVEREEMCCPSPLPRHLWTSLSVFILRGVAMRTFRAGRQGSKYDVPQAAFGGMMTVVCQRQEWWFCAEGVWAGMRRSGRVSI